MAYVPALPVHVTVEARAEVVIKGDAANAKAPSLTARLFAFLVREFFKGNFVFIGEKIRGVIVCFLRPHPNTLAQKESCM
jgi:hypothetical protein